MKPISIIMVIMALSGIVLSVEGLSYSINGKLAIPMADFTDAAKWDLV